MSSELSVIESRIRNAGKLSDIEAELVELIVKPIRVLEMSLILEHDNGQRSLFPAWRAHPVSYTHLTLPTNREV